MFFFLFFFLTVPECEPLLLGVFDFGCLWIYPTCKMCRLEAVEELKTVSLLVSWCGPWTALHHRFSPLNYQANSCFHWLLDGTDGSNGEAPVAELDGHQRAPVREPRSRPLNFSARLLKLCSRGLKRRGHSWWNSHAYPGLHLKPLGVLVCHTLRTGGRARGRVWPLVVLLLRGVEHSGGVKPGGKVKTWGS